VGVGLRAMGKGEPCLEAHEAPAPCAHSLVAEDAPADEVEDVVGGGHEVLARVARGEPPGVGLFGNESHP
jgi:hypothetical protein